MLRYLLSTPSWSTKALLVVFFLSQATPALANERLIAVPEGLLLRAPEKLLLISSLKQHELPPVSKQTQSRIKGWDYAYQKLRAAGLDESFLQEVFSDKRMPEATPVYFSVSPREPRSIYQKRNNRKERRNALNFYQEHEKAFQEAFELYGVPAEVALAILQIETRCGDYTGKARVLPRLTRLVMAADPKNVLRNFKAKKARDRALTYEQVKQRAEWLERTFLPHLIATFVVAQHQDLHPLEILGSKAGAFGLPQFLPGNYFNFGADGNGDGKVDLFQPEDAIHSVMQFLKRHGWNAADLSVEEQKAVIHEYNRSEPYVDTVLAMARELGNQLSKT